MRAVLLLWAASLGAQEREWVTAPVDAPGVEQQFFESTAAKARVSYLLSLPEDYAKRTQRRYPVLYWLHGTGGGGAGVGFLASWFRDAARAGKIPPLIVVFPNGLRAGMWCDSKDGATPIETMLIRELIPHIDASLRTIARREGRILEGFSMGGYGAARLGLLYPHLFAAVSILAAGPLDLDLAGPRARGNKGERDRLLREVYGGSIDYFRAQSPLTIAPRRADVVRGKVLIRHAVGAADNTFALNREFHELLERLRIPHTFVAPEGVDHNPRALLQALGEGNWAFYRDALGAGK